MPAEGSFGKLMAGKNLPPFRLLFEQRGGTRRREDASMLDGDGRARTSTAPTLEPYLGEPLGLTRFLADAHGWAGLDVLSATEGTPAMAERKIIDARGSFCPGPADGADRLASRWRRSATRSRCCRPTRGRRTTFPNGCTRSEHEYLGTRGGSWRLAHRGEEDAGSLTGAEERHEDPDRWRRHGRHHPREQPRAPAARRAAQRQGQAHHAFGLRPAHVPAGPALPGARPHDARRALPRPGEPARAGHRLPGRPGRGIPARQEPGEDQERQGVRLRHPGDRDRLARRRRRTIPGLAENCRDVLHRGVRIEDVQAPAGVPGRQGR